MSNDILAGRWLQLRGRAKRAWAWLLADESLAAAGNADVATGALQESYGVAKRQAIQKVTRGIDAVAGAAKRTARSLDR
ncbi:MAG: hypothetical protein WCI05_10210 [Myxococcales bacterium]|jgi:uncharacterized protein YjbJ (UPF0337 family)